MKFIAIFITSFLFITDIKADTKVWAWGANADGQLGMGDTTARWQPTQINLLTNITAISAGDGHSLALKSDSTVWAWGTNSEGELGIGSSDFTPHSTPVQTLNLTNIIAISAGTMHSLALKSDSTVWAWGDNSYGEIGDNTNGNKRDQPVRTNLLTNVIAIAAGMQYSLALKSDDTVWAWGNNGCGELGDNSTTDRDQPVQTNILTNVIAIAAGGATTGYGHSLALKSDGTVWAWGYNGYGQLGIGDTTDRWQPVQITILTNVSAIAAGMLHSLALKSDSTVWAWGWNAFGELGDSTTTDRWQPVRTNILNNIIAISTGYAHSLALKSDSTVWAWGYNYAGELGDSTTTTRIQPVRTNILTNVSAISTGAMHSLALANGPTAVELEPSNTMSYLNIMPTIASHQFNIEYNIPKEIKLPVSLRIYDQLGRVIRTLFDGTLTCGQHTTTWDACDEYGKPVPHGSYFCILKTNYIERKKVIVIK
ncbi:MAG: FlgD immunoglobulin-like domain containing protein [bacterium]|nr:FlgD immunoglobulin-like domain containing protein [bacterium]